jgi:hypothetical protein
LIRTPICRAGKGAVDGKKKSPECQTYLNGVANTAEVLMFISCVKKG